MVVCKDHLDKLKERERVGHEAAMAVEEDISRLLNGKTYQELSSLQRRVQEKLGSGEPIDTEYWESLLKKLLVWKAKVRVPQDSDAPLLTKPFCQSKLKTLHEVVVRNRLEQLRKKQRDEALQAQEELLAGVAKAASKPISEVHVAGTALDDVSPEDVEPYHRSMSPVPINIARLSLEERQIPIVSAVEDRRELLTQRRLVAGSRFVPKVVQQETQEALPEKNTVSNADLASEAMYRAEAEKDLDEEEELFNLEEDLPNPTSYNWEDKYRPRKPRYFNRVHTGYEWNKYNQTHYE